MERYNWNPRRPVNYIVNDTANTITLREDVYTVFGKKSIFSNSQIRCLGSTHFLQLTHELGSCYHNTQFQFHRGISHAFLLARFCLLHLSIIRCLLQ